MIYFFLIHKEYIHPNSKPVVQCDLKMKYISRFKNMREASNVTGVLYVGINKNCSHKLKTSGGFIWMYEEEYEAIKNDPDKLNEIIKNVEFTNINRNAVVQLNKDMKYIADYSSILEANKITGIDRDTISKVCKGKYRQAGGYIWMYLSDYINDNKIA